jgi:putative CocE/NonD family hydrolase
VGLLCVALLALTCVPFRASAAVPFVTRDLVFTTSDGVQLHATVGGYGDLRARPVILEDTPYDTACCNAFAGPAYNYVNLHWRGTGKSGGVFNTTGPRDQLDLAQFVNWACGQRWSNQRIGLYGFSASAIIVYNSMHQAMPCVKATALMSGTVDLYRDLLQIGGINNTVPGLAVAAGIGGPWLAEQQNQRDPFAFLSAGAGHLSTPVTVASHPTYDDYWKERSFRGQRTPFPVLADDGFYDVESRGAFLGYRATRAAGSKLLVIGAHDGWPVTTRGPFPAYARWFDHHLRGLRNGVDREPRVDLYLSKGSHLGLLDGSYHRVTGTDWPLPQTRWQALYLQPDRTLTPSKPGTAAALPYAFAPSNPLATDEHTVATVGYAGAGPFTPNGLGHTIPATRDMTTVEAQSLTFTTAPFARAVTAVGPASLTVHLASSATYTDIVAVLADVAPDGSAHAVAQGQLRTQYPYLDGRRTLRDRRTGEVVQPYNDYTHQKLTTPGTTREYTVEILPIGNQFAAGHRLRLYLVGTAATMQSAPPGLNIVSVGGATPSRLVFPTIR